MNITHAGHLPIVSNRAFQNIFGCSTPESRRAENRYEIILSPRQHCRRARLEVSPADARRIPPCAMQSVGRVARRDAFAYASRLPTRPTPCHAIPHQVAAPSDLGARQVRGCRGITWHSLRFHTAARPDVTLSAPRAMSSMVEDEYAKLVDGAEIEDEAHQRQLAVRLGALQQRESPLSISCPTMLATRGLMPRRHAADFER